MLKSGLLGGVDAYTAIHVHHMLGNRYPNISSWLNDLYELRNKNDKDNFMFLFTRFIQKLSFRDIKYVIEELSDD